MLRPMAPKSDIKSVSPVQGGSSSCISSNRDSHTGTCDKAKAFALAPNPALLNMYVSCRGLDRQRHVCLGAYWCVNMELDSLDGDGLHDSNPWPSSRSLNQHN